MATPLSIVNGPKATQLSISEPLDSAAAQHAVRQMAVTLGFPGNASEELALAVAELASNLLKHAGGGTLTLRPLYPGGCVGIEVEASDHGPGIADVEQSFADGYSTSGSLGYGLGSVNRLMDEIDISSAPDSGTQIVCRRWLRTNQKDLTGSRWEVGVFTRPCQGWRQNGDAFVVKEWQGQLLVGVIDGLGHGELAQKAALAAQLYVETHYDQPLEKIFSGVARASRATRGVVMALAMFRSSARLHFLSIGNVEVRAWSGPERLSFFLQRGILGGQQSSPRVQEFKWKSDWLLVLHTDGLRARWQWSDFPGLQREPAEFAARKLMRALATEHDDATVLVVRHRTS